MLLWNVTPLLSCVPSHQLDYCNCHFFVVQNDDLDDANCGPVDDILGSQQQDIHSSFPTEVFGTVDAYTGDNLVTPPCKVCAVHLCNIILRLHIM
jgi:hypothetical protein